MGRTAAGIRGNGRYKQDSKHAVSLVSLGLTHAQIKEYGSEEELGGWVKYYNQKVKEYIANYSVQVKTGSDKQIKEHADYYKNHPLYGTHKGFSATLKEYIKLFESGDYKRSILDFDGLTKEIVDSEASMYSKRFVILREKKLRKV